MTGQAATPALGEFKKEGYRPPLPVGKEVSLPISGLVEKFYVRRILDDDTVINYALIYEADPERMPPIKVTPDWVVVDGRHRVAAALYAGLKEIKAIVIPTPEDFGELIVTAFTCNVGGAKPPTKQDITLTVKSLLQLGWSSAKIAKSLPFPLSVARRYVSDTQTSIRRALINQALDAVNEQNLTLAQAAAKYGLEPQELKSRINSQRRTGPIEVEAVKGNMSTRYKGYTLQNTLAINRVFDDYLDGQLSEVKVRDILTHLGKLSKSHMESILGYRERFEAMVDEYGKK